MSKKFDVVIGNPPYQDEAQGEGTRDTPVYHLFVDAAYDVGRKAVLITPARFLFNAGLTPKAWNEKMLADQHLSVPVYVPDSGKLFPGTDIKGGIAVTYRDEDRVGDAIGTFAKHQQVNEILYKISLTQSPSIEPEVSSSSSYRYTHAMHEANPSAASLMSKSSQYKVNTNAFEQLAFLFMDSQPADSSDFTRVLGLIKNKRVFRWIRSDYVTGPANFAAYKVAVAKANGNGSFGEVLSSPTILGPGDANTQSFITIGNFAEESASEACLKYVKSKLARAMLGVLKTTQDNPARVWGCVPSQDFTSASDIDWSKSIPEIDQQLYAKYKLDAEEIAFIESRVKPME